MAILTYLSPLVSVPVKVTIISKKSDKKQPLVLAWLHFAARFQLKLNSFFLDILMFCVGKVKPYYITSITSFCQHWAKKLVQCSTLVTFIETYHGGDAHMTNLSTSWPVNTKTRECYVKAAQKCSHLKTVTWIAPKLLVFIIIEG